MFARLNQELYFMDYPEYGTVNKEYYVQVIRCLCEAIHQKISDLWANISWILHHDNNNAIIIL